MISVTTPSIRPEMLEIVKKCLYRQTFKDFEWLICGVKFEDIRELLSLKPGEKSIKSSITEGVIPVQEPPKREGDYYSLNKAWNALFKKAKGELIVNITDGIWFEPTLLENLWNHYLANPKACISCVGNQYDQLINGKPEHMTWRDPRIRTDQGAFYEVESSEMELCIASFPRQAVIDIGGFDEKYDQGAALSEKEAMLRAQKSGYKMYLDQTLEYRAIHHPRLSKDWDDKYKIASEMYLQDIKEILSNKRSRLAFLENSGTTRKVSENEPT